MIDSTIVRAHQQATSGKRGKDQARGGLTTKIHMPADALGRPLCFIPLYFIMTAGQVGDITQAPALLEGQEGRAVLADNAYDGNALRAIIADMSADAVIPSNRTQKIIFPTIRIVCKIAIASSEASTS